MKNNVLILLSFVSLLSCSKQDNFLLSSPNRELQVTIANQDNTGTFSVIYAMDTILKPSTFGLQVDETNYSENVSYLDLTKTEFDEIWTTVNGKQPTVRNYYNEYKLRVAKTKDEKKFHEIIFRIYDKGFAYRYNFPSEAIGDSLKIKKELTELYVTGDFKYWAYNGESHNMGPVLRSAKSIDEVRIPVVLQLHNEKFMAIHEAEIIEFAPFSINASINNQLLGWVTVSDSVILSRYPWVILFQLISMFHYIRYPIM